MLRNLERIVSNINLACSESLVMIGAKLVELWLGKKRVMSLYVIMKYHSCDHVWSGKILNFENLWG